MSASSWLQGDTKPVLKSGKQAAVIFLICHLWLWRIGFLFGNFSIRKAESKFSNIAIEQANELNNAILKGDGDAIWPTVKGSTRNVTGTLDTQSLTTLFFGVSKTKLKVLRF